MATELTPHYLARAFSERFPGAPPTAIVTAPGRVNLIGDHTDYNGLPVFPMAIPRACRIVFRRRDDDLITVLSGDGPFEPREFRLAPTIAPFEAAGDWGNYLKAAAQALCGREEGGFRFGFDALVTSDVPIAGGLSSSSALVVAVSLAILEVNALEISRIELAGVLAAGERYVGTQGGGMDQAVCLLSKKGHASMIDFKPLRSVFVAVPSSWRFVVASSLVGAEKSGAQREAYNLRTRESRQALERVNVALGLDRESGTYSELLAHFDQRELLRAGGEVLDSPARERFRHVLSEADRVGRAAQAMRDGDLAEFGRLMTESHASLRYEYEVSCDELNSLVEIALDAGAPGARLTGAGFGGCVVVLAREEQVDTVTESLQDRFYSARGIDAKAAGRMFIAEPSQGATIERI